MDNMITVVTRFQLPAGVTADQIRAAFDDAAPTFRNVPGLVRKQFLHSKDCRTAGGVYLWNDERAARAFMNGRVAPKIMKDSTSITSLVNMDNRHYRRYVYGNPKREQEIKNLYKISSTIMGLWLVEQVDKGGLQEENRRAVSNSLGRLLLPMIDSLGSKLVELEQV